jgi:pimeloyl-ACP methyl ester carboxylesterase
MSVVHARKTAMTSRIGTVLACVLLLAAAGSVARAAEAQLVSVKTPRGITQSFILIASPHAKAAVILFAGGDGFLGLTSASSMKSKKNNFLVRTRERFAADGFTVAVVDAPADREKMTAIFRMSGAHAGDIGAVVAYLKKQANIPVWLVGTSMGTFSAADGAIAGHAVGLGLTSTITHSPPQWKIAGSHPNGVASMELSRVTVPTLIVSHRHDSCGSSPAAGAPKLKNGLSHATPVDVVLIDGGKPPKSEPCQALSRHGYFGVEDKAVGAIAAFIKANTR